MKRITLCTILILSCISLCALQCRKKNELPDETQDGKRTFGCTIDGAIFKTKGSLYVPAIKCDYESIYGGEQGFTFRIVGNNQGANCAASWVAVFGDSIKIEQGNTYTLKEKKRGNFHGTYQRAGSCSGAPFSLETNEITNGEISFSRFDLENQVAAGSFWFDVKDESGKTIKIRDGRFDMPFIR